jgi:regulator of replication initiation timing
MLFLRFKDTTLKLIPQKNARLANDKALHALCQAPNEGTKLVKSYKLQMLISIFEEIKMLEEETFGEFYTKISDLRNSMVSLGKSVSDVKLIQKILRSLLEHFRIKVTTIEESKDLEKMKIEELVGSLQTH